MNSLLGAQHPAAHRKTSPLATITTRVGKQFGTDTRLQEKGHEEKRRNTGLSSNLDF